MLCKLITHKIYDNHIVWESVDTGYIHIDCCKEMSGILRYSQGRGGICTQKKSHSSLTKK